MFDPPQGWTTFTPISIPLQLSRYQGGNKGFLESLISPAGALIRLVFSIFVQRYLYDPGAGRFIHPTSPTATAAPRTDVLSVSFSALP